MGYEQEKDDDSSDRMNRLIKGLEDHSTDRLMLAHILIEAAGHISGSNVAEEAHKLAKQARQDAYALSAAAAKARQIMIDSRITPKKPILN